MLMILICQNQDIESYDIEDDLKIVNEWLTHNRLIINWKKTVAMHISAKNYQKDIALNNNPNIEITKHKFINFDNKIVEFTKTFKILGVMQITDSVSTNKLYLYVKKLIQLQDSFVKTHIFSLIKLNQYSLRRLS